MAGALRRQAVRLLTLAQASGVLIRKGETRATAFRTEGDTTKTKICIHQDGLWRRWCAKGVQWGQRLAASSMGHEMRAIHLRAVGMAISGNQNVSNNDSTSHGDSQYQFCGDSLVTVEKQNQNKNEKNVN